jgi:hypothetical protein
MASCEDFPACGHEHGCCPRYDASGKQLDMVCTCGARLPITARFSICRACIGQPMPEEGSLDEDRGDFDGYDDEGEDYDPDADDGDVPDEEDHDETWEPGD